MSLTRKYTYSETYKKPSAEKATPLSALDNKNK